MSILIPLVMALRLTRLDFEEGEKETPQTETAEPATDGEPDGPRSFEALQEATDDLTGSCRRAVRRAERTTPTKAKKESRAVRKCERAAIWKAQGERIDAEQGTFRSVMSPARKARCATAICWGPSNRWAFEPLAEIPVGKTFAFPGSGVGRFINGNGVDVRLDAGFRFWFAYDWVSLAVYLSTPNFAGSKETVRISGSSFEYPVSQVRRPLPGLAVGLLGDMMWVGFDYNQIRNGSTTSTQDRAFPANEIVSHALSISIAIAPLAGFRNGIGTAVEANRKKKAAENQPADDSAEEASTPEDAANEGEGEGAGSSDDSSEETDATEEPEGEDVDPEVETESSSDEPRSEEDQPPRVSLGLLGHSVAAPTTLP